jgi:hypothetical protein
MEKDHEILNKTYMKELKRADTMHQALQRVKQAVNAMIGKKVLCERCRELTEIKDL